MKKSICYSKHFGIKKRFHFIEISILYALSRLHSNWPLTAFRESGAREDDNFYKIAPRQLQAYMSVATLLIDHTTLPVMLKITVGLEDIGDTGCR